MTLPAERLVTDWPADVAFCARVWPDWTVLQLPNGDAFAFERATGRVYKLPHKDCPIVIWPSHPELPE